MASSEQDAASPAEGPRNKRKLQEPGAEWRVWKAADRLESDGLTTTKSGQQSNPTVYHSMTIQVVAVLREWGRQWAGQPNMTSLLNKRTILHEVEESIVALHHLREWIVNKNKDPSKDQRPLIAVDVCCGKGYFSMLLSYLVPEWKKETNRTSIIDKIILLDKAAISWTHIDLANASHKQEDRPYLELWKGVNLHDFDVLLDRFNNLNAALAFTGIHLCKMLGPACVSLVNGLGSASCPYLCLAPCCLPRVAISSKPGSVITVNSFETHQQRQERRNAMERRKQVMGRGLKGKCYLCGQKDKHRVRDCPALESVPKDKHVETLQKAALSVPCWNCGLVGHFKADCPSSMSKPTRVEPPTAKFSVSTVAQSPQPFHTYCQLLSNAIEMTTTKELMQPGLENIKSQHQDGNWNGSRKSIYIVATR